MKVLIDYSWLCYRSHYGFRHMKVDKRGCTYHTGMLHGVWKTLSTIFSFEPSADVVFCIDGKPDSAIRIQEDYKATRADTKDASSESAMMKLNPDDVIKPFLRLPQVSTAYHPLMEADDSIGFLAEMMPREPGETLVILTTDLDMRQLIDEDKLIFCAAAETPHGFELEDSLFVKNKWGMTPKAIAVFKAIKGDSSDNIKGVWQFPTKLALRLCDSFNTLDALRQYAFHSKSTSNATWRRRLQESFALVERNYAVANIDPEYVPIMDMGTGSELNSDESAYLEYYEASRVGQEITSLIAEQLAAQ